MSEKLQEAYQLYEKLKQVFTNIRLEVSTYKDNETVEIRAYDVKNLIQFKKLSGCSKLTKMSLSDFQAADGEINGIHLHAYTTTGETFSNKCHIIREPVVVPATPEHTEYRTRIVCDGQ